MLPHTIEAVSAILRTDPSLTTFDRKTIMAGIREYGRRPHANHHPKPQTRIVKRKEVAERLQCSLRQVDKLAEDGVLMRYHLPGRQRATGFLSEEVERLFKSPNARTVYKP